MLQWIPGPVKGTLNTIFIVLHTLFWCVPLYFFYFLRIITNSTAFRSFINRCIIKVCSGWIRSNNLMMQQTMSIDLEVPPLDHLSKNQWYFVICNHQSWTDILILQKIFLNKIPFLRFFIKKQLLWLPAINLAWLALDFPIMHRHSKEQIAKNPELRNKDRLATKRACEKYQHMPVTILNFLEGTRFTPKKHQHQQSIYQHLLMPKIGGFSLAINAMDKKITHVLDVTIVYPDGRQTFWDFLCGRVHRIIVKLTEREVPADLLQGNYTDDEAYRKKFKQWIEGIWLEKDTLIDKLSNFPPR
ncbi:MAG: acyltransferase [Candidatus Berkiella sp.]